MEYKIWIEIEEYDPETDTYQNLELDWAGPFGYGFAKAMYDNIFTLFRGLPNSFELVEADRSRK